MHRVLLVDDEASLLDVASAILRKENFEVLTALNGLEALEILESTSVDLVVTDLRMKPVDGLEVLRRVKSMDSDIEVVMITAYASVENAVEAMKLGAFDYIIKPFKMEEFRVVVRKALSHRKLLLENVRLRSELERKYRFENIVGTSEVMQDVYRLISKVANTATTILIQGESGTGKELVARAIHYNGRHRRKRFVAVSCGAIPEGLLESELFGHVKGSFTGAIRDKDGLFMEADRGTIFLDEIGATPPPIQMKLLRVLQEKAIKRVGDTREFKVDARVIAATNENLWEAVEKGRFREDLYYRLSIIPIEIPPLRHRREDIPLLATHFLKKKAPASDRRLRLSKGIMDILVHYDWPGNVRELENVMERAVTLCEGEEIGIEDLPPRLTSTGEPLPAAGQPQDLRCFVRSKEREHILEVLREAKGDKKSAARMLGIDLATFYRKIANFKEEAERVNQKNKKKAV